MSHLQSSLYIPALKILKLCQLICCFRIVKPHPQIRILVPFRGSFQNVGQASPPPSPHLLPPPPPPLILLIWRTGIKVHISADPCIVLAKPVDPPKLSSVAGTVLFDETFLSRIFTPRVFKIVLCF